MLTTFNIEVGAGLAVRVVGPLEIRGGFEFRRYFLAFDPDVGDANVAGGAVDHYFTGSLGLAIRF